MGLIKYIKENANYKERDPAIKTSFEVFYIPALRPL